MTIENGAELVVPEQLFWGLVLKFTTEATPAGLAEGIAAAVQTCSELGAERSEGQLEYAGRAPDGRLVRVLGQEGRVAVVRVES